MVRQHASDTSLYKQWRENPDFRASFSAVIRRMIENQDTLDGSAPVALPG